MADNIVGSSKHNSWLEVRLTKLPGRDEAIPLSHVDVLWLRMSMIYAGKFTSQFKDACQVEVWKLE